MIFWRAFFFHVTEVSVVPSHLLAPDTTLSRCRFGMSRRFHGKVSEGRSRSLRRPNRGAGTELRTLYHNTVYGIYFYIQIYPGT